MHGPEAASESCHVHTPAASRRPLSTRSERRQSRPWAPTTRRSSSLLGMGSSESHCSTSQLKGKKTNHSGDAGPQPLSELAGIVFCLLWLEAVWGWLNGIRVRCGRPQKCPERVAGGGGEGLSQSTGSQQRLGAPRSEPKWGKSWRQFSAQHQKSFLTLTRGLWVANYREGQEGIVTASDGAWLQ